MRKTLCLLALTLCCGVVFPQVELGTYDLLGQSCYVLWFPETESYCVQIAGEGADGMQGVLMCVGKPEVFRRFLDRTLSDYREFLAGGSPKWRSCDMVLGWPVDGKPNAVFASSRIEPRIRDKDGTSVLAFYDGVTDVVSGDGDVIRPVLFFESVEELERFAFLLSKGHLLDVVTELEEAEQSLW